MIIAMLTLAELWQAMLLLRLAGVLLDYADMPISSY